MERNNRLCFKSALPLVLAVLICLTSHTASSATEPTLISVDDLYRLDAAQGSIVLPNSSGLVYSRRWSDRSSRTVRYALWRVNDDGTQRRAMEEGEPDGRQPLLSPDGKWIIFLSTRPVGDGKLAVVAVPPYSDPAIDIWLIPASGGKAIPLAGPEKNYGHVFSDPFYGNVSFSADGKRLVFVADDGRDVRTPEEIRNNVRIVREDQGEGYEGYRPAQIWIGQTNQFRAAVPQNAVTDLNVMWGLSDIQSWTEWEFGGRPWEVSEIMHQRSPLTHASKVQTPTLILHAANDRRCPLPMGAMYYRALKESGVETEMVIYPDEGHPIRQLPHMEDVLIRVLDWFARHEVPGK